MSTEGKVKIEKSITENGITKCYTVDEVENGFIITISKSGYDKSKGEKESEYINECKKYISKTNPLDKKKEEEPEEDGTMFDFVNSVNF